MIHWPKSAICTLTVFINNGAVIKKILPINAYESSLVNLFISKYERKDCNKKHKNIQIEKKWKLLGKKFFINLKKIDTKGAGPEKTIELPRPKPLFGFNPIGNLQISLKKYFHATKLEAVSPWNNQLSEVGEILPLPKIT